MLRARRHFRGFFGRRAILSVRSVFWCSGSSFLRGSFFVGSFLVAVFCAFPSISDGFVGFFVSTIVCVSIGELVAALLCFLWRAVGLGYNVSGGFPYDVFPLLLPCVFAALFVHYYIRGVCGGLSPCSFSHNMGIVGVFLVFARSVST